MKEGKEITRLEANEIIKDWHNSNKPYKRVVCVWKGQWYDLRDLTDKEIDLFIAKVSGIIPTKENTMNLDFRQ